LLSQGQWFSLGTADSSTTKTDRHDIAEVLLKVALKQQTINQSPQCGDTTYCIRQTNFFNFI
jgi:hypothetical protein